MRVILILSGLIGVAIVSPAIVSPAMAQQPAIQKFTLQVDANQLVTLGNGIMALQRELNALSAELQRQVIAQQQPAAVPAPDSAPAPTPAPPP